MFKTIAETLSKTLQKCAELLPRRLIWTESAIVNLERDDALIELNAPNSFKDKNSTQPVLYEVTVCPTAINSATSDVPIHFTYITSPLILTGICKYPSFYNNAMFSPANDNTDGCQRMRYVSCLINKGVTCYVNSCIQVVLNNTYLQRLFTNQSYRNIVMRSSNCKAILDSIDNMLLQGKTRNPASQKLYPVGVLNTLSVFKMSPYRMGDSNELLSKMLDCFAQEESTQAEARGELDSRSRDTTAIDQLLGVWIKTTIKCKACGHETNNYVLSRQIQVPLAKRLESSILSYLKPVEISGYTCSNCGPNKTILKMQSLVPQATGPAPVFMVGIARWDWEMNKKNGSILLPEYLNLSGEVTESNVKKIAYTTDTHFKAGDKSGKNTKLKKKNEQSNKIASSIDKVLSTVLETKTVIGDGINLDESSDIYKTCTHRLSGIICHSGITIYSGHYYAMCRNPMTGRWELRNDEILEPIDTEDVLNNSNAVVVVYESVRGNASQIKRVDTAQINDDNENKVDSDDNRKPEDSDQEQSLDENLLKVTNEVNIFGDIDIGLDADSNENNEEEQQLGGVDKEKETENEVKNEDNDMNNENRSSEYESKNDENSETESSSFDEGTLVFDSSALRKENEEIKEKKIKEGKLKYNMIDSAARTIEINPTTFDSRTEFEEKTDNNENESKDEKSDPDKADQATKLAPSQPRRHKFKKITDLTKLTKKIGNVSGWEDDENNVEVKAIKASVKDAEEIGGELSRVSPLLHANVSEDDSYLDRGRTRKTQKMRDQNREKRHKEIVERKHHKNGQKIQKWEERKGIKVGTFRNKCTSNIKKGRDSSNLAW